MSTYGWGAKDIGVKYEGDCYETPDDGWEAANVVNSSEDDDNIPKFWNDNAWKGKGPKICLKNQKCGFVCNTGNESIEGGHVWLRRIATKKENTRMISTFCFIMPTCGTCNRERKNKENFQPIKKYVRLVAREPTENME